jgi:mono/diheme cytochrome c family protein
MRRQIQIVFFFLLAMLAQLPSTYASDEGQELYDQYCSNCHGPDKEGLQIYTGDLEAFTARLNGVTENMSDFTDFFDDDEIVVLYEYVMQPE